MKAEERFNKLNSFWRIYGENYYEWARYSYGQELWERLQNILAEGGEGMVIINEDSLYQPGKRSNSVSLKIKKELQDTIDCVIIGANSPTKLYSGKEIEEWTYWLDELTDTRYLSSEYLEKFHKTPYQVYVEGAALIPVTKNWYYGWAGSLKLGLYDEKQDKFIYIGNLSGITEEVKENWHDYIGKVAEITAMEIMDNESGGRGLRHPKLKNFRQDKNPKECSISQIM